MGSICICGDRFVVIVVVDFGLSWVETSSSSDGGVEEAGERVGRDEWKMNSVDEKRTRKRRDARRI